ncbi:MAG: hypothetical protein JRJ11_16315, partial [Deltaproteobacteria bacterium]|nr:hypothetical protein [Deltaproteobacteria bacterium]MBW2035763.1 hypothetical protein [Deltaproteobacteria bacterium]
IIPLPDAMVSCHPIGFGMANEASLFTWAGRRIKRYSLDVEILPSDKEKIREYYQKDKEKGVKEKKAKKKKALPPGLKKKVARGGELPPGWQKK